MSFDDTGVCGQVQRLVVDDGDQPRLFASTVEGDANGGSDVYFALWTPAEPRWASDFIVLGGVIGGGYGISKGLRGRDGVLGSDGRPRALVYSTSPALYVYDRMALGYWRSAAQVNVETIDGTIVVDSFGRVRIVYTGAYGSKRRYVEWTDGTELPDFRKDGVDPSVAVAAGLAGIIGVARVTEDGIAVTFSDGATVSDDQPIANTIPIPRGEPCYSDHAICEPVVCEKEGLSNGSISLAATADGTFWLAYRYLHERAEYEVVGVSGANYCWKLSQSTVTTDVVLVRLSADGPQTPSVRWHYSTSNDRLANAELVARGQRLYLGFPNGDAAYVFVIDAEQL